MKRFGRNQGGYFGERIDVHAMLPSLLEAASAQGWRQEVIASTPEPGLWALIRGGAQSARRLYISAGMHGDEPAGVLAAALLVTAKFWPADLGVWLCPCLNPTGFALNRRESAQGLDLNRQYRNPEASETRAHIEWLDRQPSFDAALCLHEDWEANGFYLYELAEKPHVELAERVIQDTSAHTPIDMAAEIEGRAAQGGIIRPSTDPLSRPDWPEAFYLFNRKTRLCYTFESPSDFDLQARAGALARAVQTTVESLFPGSMDL